MSEGTTRTDDRRGVRSCDARQEERRSATGSSGVRTVFADTAGELAAVTDDRQQ